MRRLIDLALTILEGLMESWSRLDRMGSGLSAGFPQGIFGIIGRLSQPDRLSNIRYSMSSYLFVPFVIRHNDDLIGREEFV